MPKGYIKFEDFKSQHPHRPYVRKCPRCHKPMPEVYRNINGKNMCYDCFLEDLEKREAARRKKNTEELFNDNIEA